MECSKCGGAIPPEGRFCPFCGKATERRSSRKQRGNGQGWISQLPSGRWLAQVTLGYYTDEAGKRHRKTRSQTFDRKKDAVAAIPRLLADPKKEARREVTFKALADAWLPTHRAGASTVGCYRAALRYFEPVFFLTVSEIDVDDLQECLDECPHGKRTRENMKAACGLVYKYGIPRHVIPDNLNLAQFLTVEGDGAAHRVAFNDVELEKIRRAVGIVPHADEIFALCYLGFRPSEFLALTAADYDRAAQTLTGGAKTEAGRGRVVTVSPKIAAILEARAASGGYLFPDPSGGPWSVKRFTERAFYPALEKIGIDNPLVEVGGGKLRHKFTPHSCRHTFATLLKRVEGADKDKMELIGHASAEQLRYYQDAPLDDLRAITDKI